MNNNKQKINIQYVIIILIIIGSFLGSTVLFTLISTSSVRKYIYERTNTSLFALKTEILSGVVPDEVFLARSGFTFYLCQKDGTIISTSDESNPDDLLSIDLFSEYSDILDVNSDKFIYYEIETQGNPLYTSGRSISATSYSDDQVLILFANGDEVRSSEARQFALILFIELLLLVIVIILVSNTIFRYRNQIVKLATFDDLTGLSNRRSFTMDFERFITNKPRSSSLFILDVDYFKQINDNYGHAAGDKALKLVADNINSLILSNGLTAARWGGDEFIGILSCGVDEATMLLEKLNKDISNIKTDENFKITVSIGFTDIADEVNLSKITEMADLALYTSKKAGRDCVTLYDPSISDSIFNNETTTIKTSSSEFSDRSTDEAPKINKDLLKTRFKIFTRQKMLDSIISGTKAMIPFIAGGGILIGFAFLFDAASTDLSTLSIEERSDLGSITNIARVLKEIGQTCFNFMLPIFSAFMAKRLVGKEAFMAGFVGGCMAIDANAGFVGAICAAIIASFISYNIKVFSDNMRSFGKYATQIIIYPIISLLLMYLFSHYLLTPITQYLRTAVESLLDLLSAHSIVLSDTVASALMATDMGGIFNKAAYSYGTGSISNGSSHIMAAVMLGGMVPPIGISISMLLFKRKYSKPERSNLAATLFMGISFITESVLPFVLLDMFRVIVSCVAGAAVSGCLSSLFGCRLPAPHGGIFVFPLVTNAPFYVIALIAGSFVTAILLGIWRKDTPPDENYE